MLGERDVPVVEPSPDARRPAARFPDEAGFRLKPRGGTEGVREAFLKNGEYPHRSPRPPTFPKAFGWRGGRAKGAPAEWRKL